MTELSQIALEFAKRCLGWKVAIPQADGQFEWFSNDADEPSELFFYGDLSAVMKAVRDWAQPQDRSLGLYFQLPLALEGWLWGSEDAELLCRDLMSACVEAAKKLEVA